MTASWERILEISTNCAHFCEFHRPDDRRGGQSAGRFLSGALRDGGVAVAVAAPRNAAGILSQLASAGCDPIAAMQRGSFVLMDSSRALSRFVHAGSVDAQQFERTLGAAMRQARDAAAGAPVRAFGDMVGLLWQRGERGAAIELERLWQELQREIGFALFCAYPVDVFSAQFSSEELEGVFATHTHVFPSGSSADLGRVLDRAMDDVLGAQAARVRGDMRAREGNALPPMPKAEQTILWLREHLPEFAETIMERARELHDIASPRVYLRQEHTSG